MDLLLKILLCLPLFIIGRISVNYISTFSAGLRFARKTPIPTVTVYVHHLNVFLFIFSPFLTPIFDRLPYRFSRWFRYARNDNAYLWRDRPLPRQELNADVYFQVGPGGNGGGGTGGVTLKVGDPAVAAQIIQRGKDFPKASYIYGAARFLGDNVVTSDEDSYQFHRRVTAPPFNEANNDAVFRVAQDLTRKMMNTFEKDGGRTSDLIHWTGRFALHVITAAGFGVEMPWTDETVPEKSTSRESIHPGEFRKAVEDTLNGVNWIVVFPRWLMRKLPFNWIRTTARGVDEFERDLHILIKNGTRRNELGTPGNDLLSTMLRVRNNVEEDIEKDNSGRKKGTMSDQDIVGNTFIFIVAGHETTATALGSSILHLAVYPDIQREAQREVDDIWSSKSDGSEGLDYLKDFPKMRFLTAILLENLRLYPAAGTILKMTNGETQRLTYGATTFTVPPLAHVDLDAFTLQRHPSYWGPNPDEFDPHRWLMEPGYVPPKGSLNPAKDQKDLLCPPHGAFVAFSDGMRSCLGRKFAHVEMAAALATVLRDYNIELDIQDGETWEEAKADMVEALQDRSSSLTFCLNRKMPVRFVPRKRANV